MMSAQMIDSAYKQVPAQIADLNIVSVSNRPMDSDWHSPGVTAAHLRACYAFIAQLQRQIDELKAAQTDKPPEE